jgi:NitT/TauT family transport system substrate-binding protein
MNYEHSVPSMPRSAAMTLVAGGVFAAALPARAQTNPAPVKMGAMAIDASGEAYYGDGSGIFLNNGISPQITTVSSGSAIIAAVLAGDLDVGLANPLQIASAISHGIPLQMIAPAVVYSKSDANPNFVVAKDGPIKAPKDLVGATFGVTTLADLNTLSLMAWLDANKVPRDGVKFVELKFGELGQALVRGTIQAAIITEPFKTDAMRAGQIREFGDTYLAIAPEISPMVWFASKAWLQKNPDTAKRLINGIYATAKWANSHTKESGDMLAKIAKMDPAVVANMKRLYFATSNDKKYSEALLNLAARYGMVAHPVTFEEYTAF